MMTPSPRRTSGSIAIITPQSRHGCGCKPDARAARRQALFAVSDSIELQEGSHPTLAQRPSGPPQRLCREDLVYSLLQPRTVGQAVADLALMQRE